MRGVRKPYGTVRSTVRVLAMNTEFHGTVIIIKHFKLLPLIVTCTTNSQKAGLRHMFPPGGWRHCPPAHLSLAPLPGVPL